MTKHEYKRLKRIIATTILYIMQNRFLTKYRLRCESVYDRDDREYKDIQYRVEVICLLFPFKWLFVSEHRFLRDAIEEKNLLIDQQRHKTKWRTIHKDIEMIELMAEENK
jgi:hypothetical protein